MAIGDGGMSIRQVRRPFTSLGIASSGLSGQRARIEAYASNIANANAVNADGTPYQRRDVILREVGFDAVLQAQVQEGTTPEGIQGGVELAGMEIVESEGTPVYMPEHPNADEDGMVLMPAISIEEEMMGLMEARRLYDANATVFEAVKSMLRRAAQI